MEFLKVQGAGNDFILIDSIGAAPPAIDAVKWCDRRTGIGADGVLLLTACPGHDARMTVYNSDGSPAEMCGNGLRCAAKYLMEKAGADRASVLTGAGTLRAGRTEDGIACYMGRPVFDPARIPVLSPDGRVKLRLPEGEREFLCVSMGNPHAVCFCDEPERARFLAEGPLVEHDPHFPNRVNVGFCTVLSRRSAILHVWERGDGETLACGTGTCAAFAAGRKEGLFDEACSFTLPGGVLTVTEREDGLYLSGPAETVFRGFLPD